MTSCLLRQVLLWWWCDTTTLVQASEFAFKAVNDTLTARVFIILLSKHAYVQVVEVLYVLSKMTRSVRVTVVTSCAGLQLTMMYTVTGYPSRFSIASFQLAMVAEHRRLGLQHDLHGLGVAAAVFSMICMAWG